jgi:MoaA/NifB/PqqE/SkfB family radical SAM enzyme
MWHKDTIEWVDIELTSYCNIDCPGCLRQQMHKEVGHILNQSYITLDDLKKWIPPKYLPKLRVVNFCGSVDEPTTHPEFLDIVDYFLSFTGINVATNGSTRTSKFWEELGKRKISVFFGVDGIDQESLEKYRIGSNFKKVQKNWRAFINAGGKATWQFIIFDHNKHLIEQAKQISEDEGFAKFRTIYSHRNESGEVKKE